MMRMGSVALAALALLVALGDAAAASECHYNCNGGYLGMTALVAGALALGSAALGTRMAGSSTPKRGESAASEADTPHDAPNAPRDAHEAEVTATAAAAPPSETGLDAAKVTKAGTDYAGKIAKEMAPHGGAVDSGLGIVQKVIASEDRVAGLAEGLTDAAIDQTKDVVKDATKVAPPSPATPSPSVGTTPKYCRHCGVATREGAAFCASCGARL